MTPQELLPLVQKYAAEHGVDPELVMRIIQAESAGDPAAVSRVGAQGLMQLMPATAAELGVTDPHDPEQNIRGGTQYLAKMLAQFQDPRLAVAAYNFGPGNVAKNRPFPTETVNYVEKILGPAEAEAPVEEVPTFDDVNKGASTDNGVGLEAKRAKIISDPDFAKFDSATQQRILFKLTGDQRPQTFIGAAPTPMAPDPSTAPEAFERIMEASGISGVIDKLIGRVKTVTPERVSATPTVAEQPLNETDAAAALRGTMMAALPMAAPALLPVAGPGAAAAAIRAGTAGIGETMTVPGLLKMLGAGVPLGVGGEVVGREVG